MHMRARVKSTLPFLLAAAGAGAIALSAPGASAITPVLTNPSAKLLACDPATATATFRGSMRRVPNTERMWIRFVLYEQVGHGKFVKVDAPVFKTWRKSKAGVRKFAYNQTIKGLKMGHVYRTKVLFRWFDGNGNRIDSAERTAPLCSLASDTNLTIIAADPRPGPTEATYAYEVIVQNAGGTELERIVTQLVIDGAELDATEIPRLARGQTRKVVFTGPACRKELRAVVDPQNVIQESDETDNSFKVPCSG